MRQELCTFRKKMEEEGIDLYLARDADDHISEYNDPYFSVMQYLSGFTGGDGTLVITREEAGLWTDGRYFIQAEEELSGSGIVLRKEGEPDCPELNDWIREKIPEGGVLGFDGRCISWRAAKKLIRSLSGKNVRVKCDQDLTKELWTAGRPCKRAEKIWILEEKYAGKSAERKLKELQAELEKKGAGAHLISAMDEIAWLLNLRGNDVPCNPVFDAFFLLDGTRKKLYVSGEHLTKAVEDYLKELGIVLSRDTDEIYRDAGKIESSCVLADGCSCSWRLLNSITEKNELLEETGPVSLMKNRKNLTEAENLKMAQIKDSTAVTRFFYWFKSELQKGVSFTETDAAEKLHEFRAEQEGFLGESFETISAWGPNAAMCHYAPSREKPVTVQAYGLYLVDSGGHYPEGTTDITRTWACGPVTKEMKQRYTMTAIANLRLADQVFPEGTSGLALDLAAREIFWQNGLDYNHGTGHGVGYLLYVHENPAVIRFRASERAADNVLSEGVYLSDEPGFYKEGEYGIRLENMLLVEKAFDNEYRSFLKFRTMTLVPFDPDCMDRSLMKEGDILRYNRYHQRVLETIGPGLPEEERTWLKEMCRPL